VIIYPAIDLRSGKCVRLYQGDYARETIYNTEPLAVVKEIIAAGADWLHVIDLDAAKNPEQNQASLIGELVRSNKIKVQVGGGIRHAYQIRNLLEQGVSRVIIGSMAVSSPGLVFEWFKLFGAEKLVLAVDIIYDENKQPLVATNAWQDITTRSLFELVAYYQSACLQHVLCTNVMLDGTLKGPDYFLYEELLQRFPAIKLQASGGVSSLADIKLLREQRLDGVVIGRALYENKFTLQEALLC
jgi:phosphoribosylformimino-5-aminoimidazole carboxamide ribotide isomerase